MDQNSILSWINPLFGGGYLVLAFTAFMLNSRPERATHLLRATAFFMIACIAFCAETISTAIIPMLVNWPDTYRWIPLLASALGFIFLAITLLLLTWRGVRCLSIPGYAGHAQSVTLSFFFLLLVFVLVAIPEVSMRGDSLWLHALVLLLTLAQCVVVTLSLRWLCTSAYLEHAATQSIRWLGVGGLLLVTADTSQRFIALLYLEQDDLWPILLEASALVVLGYGLVVSKFSQPENNG